VDTGREQVVDSGGAEELMVAGSSLICAGGSSALVDVSATVTFGKKKLCREYCHKQLQTKITHTKDYWSCTKKKISDVITKCQSSFLIVCVAQLGAQSPELNFFLFLNFMYLQKNNKIICWDTCDRTRGGDRYDWQTEHVILFSSPLAFRGFK